MKRIHDLPALKQCIIDRARETRRDREEARQLEGEDRYYALEDAKAYQDAARYDLLAYGYLRGRSIAQMESPSTRLDNLADPEWVLAVARDFYMRGPDADEWEYDLVDQPDNRGFMARLMGVEPPGPKAVKRLHPPGWEEFVAHVTADIEAWNAQVSENHAGRVHSAREAAVA
jgi:hypothetical protein